MKKVIKRAAQSPMVWLLVALAAFVAAAYLVKKEDEDVIDTYKKRSSEWASTTQSAGKSVSPEFASTTQSAGKFGTHTFASTMPSAGNSETRAENPLKALLRTFSRKEIKI